MRANAFAVFVVSASRWLAAAALSRGFACVLALGAVPAYGVSNVGGVRILEPGEGMEHEAPAKPRDLNVRATQINRCPDGRGGVRLQDRPCDPVETPVAAAAAATASAAAAPGDVIDLSVLPSRAQSVATNSATAGESEKPSLLRSMRDGALKLVAVVVALYALWRLARWLRERLGQRLPEKTRPPPDSRAFGRPAPRPRAVIRRPERRRGSRWRRSS